MARALQVSTLNETGAVRFGFDKELNSFVQSYGSHQLDASLLLLPHMGFLPGDDPRMVGTVAAIGTRLMRNGFVVRYDTQGENVDGLAGAEGAFLPCGFWYADNLVMQGRMSEARALLDRLIGIANDVGLLAEEYDPVANRMLGNFPQAFSHVALVNSVYRAPERCRSRAPARGPRPVVDGRGGRRTAGYYAAIRHAHPGPASGSTDGASFSNREPTMIKTAAKTTRQSCLPMRIAMLMAGLAVSACSVNDSRVANQAKTDLVGLSELDLETCLGVPNRSQTFGSIAILSYDGTSTSSGGLSLTLPVVGGVSFSGGGFCHMTVRLENDRVSKIQYSGETDALFAPAAYCAPLVRSCLVKPKPPQS